MGLLGGMARTAVVAGTATAVSNRVSRRQANRWAAQEPEPAPAPAPAPAQPAAAASTPVDPTTAQLERLAGLHGSGVLSDEEFAAAKARLLGL